MRSLAITAALAVTACGSKPAPRDESGAAAPRPVPAAAAAGAAAAPAPGAAAAEAELPAVATAVPTRPADLQAWLVAGHYRSWAHEARPHESAGPHGDAVKTFVSPSLRASLQKGGTPHPEGAAAVKELYDASSKHTGWAVSVKVARDSASGNGWYWYEVFSTAPGAKPAYEGVGKQLCRECHTDGGSDQVLIPFPLQ